MPSSGPPRAPMPACVLSADDVVEMVDRAFGGPPPADAATFEGVARRLELPQPPQLPGTMREREPSLTPSSFPPPVSAEPHAAPPVAAVAEPTTMLVIDVSFDGERRQKRVMTAFVTVMVAIFASLATTVALSYVA